MSITNLVRSIAAVLLLTVAACSHEYKAKVESDTSWSGSFSNRTVDGSGDRTVDLDDDDGTVCVVVQKNTRIGTLSVAVIDEGNTWFKKQGNRVTTTADFGVVTACNDK